MKTNNIIAIVLCFMSIGILFSQNSSTETANLMPWPKQMDLNSNAIRIDSTLTISVLSDVKSERITKACTQFLRRLSNETGVFLKQGFPLTQKPATLEVFFNKKATLGLSVDESYSLKTIKNKIVLNAQTDIGALRGLETLLQLIHFTNSTYYFPGMVISDSPRFPWRGLLIDCSRHFQPLEVLKRNLRAMAAVKLNVFHWHLTDDQGFRLESKVLPKLNTLASDGLYYTQNQIKELVGYASDLGIRVIPEFDVPGHATALLSAYPELGSKKNATYSIERNAGIFNPTLNPTIDETYQFLEILFTEIAPLFPDPYFHIGGDENEGKHWDANPKIAAFKKVHDLKTNHDLQTYFNIKLERILKKLGKRLMGWDEILTPNLPKTAVIHSWRGENEGLPKGGSLIKAAKKGYNAVLSNGFYIDRMLSVVHHYKTEPIGDAVLTEAEHERILGGEATMWGELVTPLTIDSRIWPRTAAIAERLWSPKSVNNVDDMLKRLKVVNVRLEQLGLNHITSKAVILRMMTHNDTTSALETLTKICEPLKVYSRNKGGTEYQMYSPFTLFADACTADAEDAYFFNKHVKEFISTKNKMALQAVLLYLEKWKANHKAFLKINTYPNIKPLEPLSENLAMVSSILIKSIKNRTLTNKDLSTLSTTIETLKNPCVDVELVITDALHDLIMFCKTSYFN